MPALIDYGERIPNNVGLSGDRRLERALEGRQSKLLDCTWPRRALDDLDFEDELRLAVNREVVDRRGG
jgi:hypothetical protein